MKPLKGFRYPDDGPPADLTVEAYGSTVGEVFANTALAAFNAMTPLEAVEPRETRVFEVCSEDLEGLLFDFLSELLYIHDVEHLVFSEVEVELDPEAFRLRAVCRGERFDPERHRSRLVVKAVTYHDMKIERELEGWKARVVFDI
jgi:SHS2 domain-containing protein